MDIHHLCCATTAHSGNNYVWLKYCQSFAHITNTSATNCVSQMTKEPLTTKWSVVEGLNGVVNDAELLAVVLPCFLAVCDSSSVRRHGEEEPAVPQRTTLTARSDNELLSDAVVVHRVHRPSDDLHPSCSFLRSCSGRLFTNALSVDHIHKMLFVTFVIASIISQHSHTQKWQQVSQNSLKLSFAIYSTLLFHTQRAHKRLVNSYITIMIAFRIGYECSFIKRLVLVKTFLTTSKH